ncbi:uncharacterized protein BYT42DRAFT_534211 [Radiomyces spectabilis]|uniref:uncharacterized protein n=1 Tax=Radiomyces spectabilis TaxID=64574 RepID=UPI00221F033E|nr:uncharacterized protein BYT42DRAFT_534211 [Radiomyces spectabilis]KAI8376579.1 hypothetical protein BYT42DRAFT_534211 [Radiomyces spectabilis]
MSIQSNAPLTEYFDALNNITFSIHHKNSTTYISPQNVGNLTELKVGVLLPFHQHDNNWTKIITLSGASAIRMAVAEINAKRLIPGAYITLVEKDSYPKPVEGQAAITQAVFSAISLIQDGVIGVIGDVSSSWTSLSALMTSTLQIPQCSFSAIANSLSDKTQYGYFFRTIPTNLLYADAALSFIISQGWPMLGVLYSNDDFGQQLSENAIMKARMNGIIVKAYQSFYDDGPTSDVKSSIDTLMGTGVKIVLVAAEEDAQMTALTVAAHSGYIANDTVWITVGENTSRLVSAVERFNAVLHRRLDNNAKIVPTVTNDTQDKKTIDPIEYAAQMTNDLTPIHYNSTFAGGVFMFKARMNLPGYPPYDQFLEKWLKLNPSLYPYGGQRNISSNEGLAYSCMMVMAQGFNQVLRNASHPDRALDELAAGKLGEFMTPATFNTSFEGPTGPIVLDQNGDTMNGNFRVFNLQNGFQVEIGNILAGTLNLTALPMFHDGTTKAPTGIPALTSLNPGYSSPMSIVILCIASFGTLVALMTMLLVLFYRKHDVFKASSPLFCVLELLGFLLAYASVFFFTALRNQLNCIMVPLTFHLGYSLILGNLIAKNYRIYRIFNNIFITRTVVTDFQLLKVSGGILLVDVIILIVWLSLSKVQTVNVPVSRTAYYVGCSYTGSSHTVFVSLLTVFAAAQLAFATFLAFKTRSVGKNYSKYSEYKQIGLSVYNIFFSALIGFIIFFMPTSDYYTRHYLTAMMIVWATTFSLLALFVPKLHQFFFPSDSNKASGKASDLSGRRRSDHINKMDSQAQKETYGELISLNRMLSSPNPLGNNVHPHQAEAQGVMLEAHEAQMPVQLVFKYFPYMAAWDMKQIVLMPGIKYFSYFSERTHKGSVFGYSRASIASCVPEAYVLKVHGLGLSDILIQVANASDLEQWHIWFNDAHGGGSSCDDISGQTCATGSQQLGHHDKGNHGLDAAAKLSDSGITSRHLLDRRESGMTIGTLDTFLVQDAEEPRKSDPNPFISLPPAASLSRRRSSDRRLSSFQSWFAAIVHDPSSDENSNHLNPESEATIVNDSDIMMNPLRRRS